ncbi:hypothetical protein BYT27DRAFT_7196174 [Phlegmacium glaucopus]|nr:hypothetical protein BYT27DRAFT_7196174 [Phlegmacium glaucopus]
MTKSKMGLCTCIYGFLRVCEVVPGPIGTLYLSQNYMAMHQGSDEVRTNSTVNQQVVERVFFFLLCAIVKSYGATVLPPNRRSEKHFGFLSTLSPASKLRVPWLYLSYARSAVFTLRAAFLAIAWENIIKFGGRWALMNLGEFRATFSGGVFQRLGFRGSFITPYIHFETINNNDGRVVSINKNLGTVVKLFFEQNVFERERDIYWVLTRNSLDFVPQLYGIFRNEWMKCSALLISYVGESLHDNNNINLQEWHQLHYAIQRLHEAGIHHHDLRFGNVVKDSNGHIQIIDFSHAEHHHCDYELCPDWKWINEVRPSPPFLI